MERTIHIAALSPKSPRVAAGSTFNTPDRPARCQGDSHFVALHILRWCHIAIYCFLTFQHHWINVIIDTRLCRIEMENVQELRTLLPSIENLSTQSTANLYDWLIMYTHWPVRQWHHPLQTKHKVDFEPFHLFHVLFNAWLDDIQFLFDHVWYVFDHVACILLTRKSLWVIFLEKVKTLYKSTYFWHWICGLMFFLVLRVIIA